MRILVTGGAGFIGSHFVHLVLGERADAEIVTYDRLTYAGNLENLRDLDGHPRHRFVQGDIADRAAVEEVFTAAPGGFDAIVNFAAETHVDRAILEAGEFLRTDVLGVWVLLEALRRHRPDALFVQISTDEVYGSIDTGSSGEEARLEPRNPYSASKAGGELLALSYHRTWGTRVIVTRGSNTYGPRQFPEKLIPLFTTNALEGLPLPLYGDGRNIRDWLHVEDHARAILLAMERGEPGLAYNVAGGQERENLWIAERILESTGAPRSLLQFVADRPGHDRRYSLDGERMRALGFAPRVVIDDGLRRTVEWYRENEPWWRPLREGSFRDFYERQYGKRLTPGP